VNGVKMKMKIMTMIVIVVVINREMVIENSDGDDSYNS
jgi:hypothetical protein